jgi:CDP-diacylglycerol--serine O-phosphatidyltransferase
VRKIAIIPTLCTLGNAVCGFAAIVCAARVNVAADLSPGLAAYLSGWLIFVAMVFDVFDGYLARRVKAASNFGAELDSLCDAISFGAAPAFLLIQLGAVLEQRLFRDVYLVIACLYMICAVLRLARFNVQTSLDAKSHRTFRGLPSPAAAGCVSSLVIVASNYTDSRLLPDDLLAPAIPWLAPLGALGVALLMVSRVPYVHVANRMLHRRRNFNRVVQLVLAAAAIMIFREVALVIIFWGYVLTGLARLLWTRSQVLAESVAGEGGDQQPPEQLP